MNMKGGFMKCPAKGLVTPIYLKTHIQTPWHEKETMFYLVAANGLFVCRNHRFFQSCVPAGSGPGELAEQEAFFDIHYPKVPRRLLELTVGFFSTVGQKHNAEAIVLIAWDNSKNKVYLIVPRQRPMVYQGYYGTSAVGVEYEVPVNLPKDHFIYGDIHSHVGMAAFSSPTDKYDEKNRPGLHIVAGRIHLEPPEFHVEVIVDSVRFKVDQDRVMEGYIRREPVPKDYLKQVEIKTLHAINGYWMDNGNGKHDYVPFRDNYTEAVSVHNNEIVTIE
jgi:hypothetical protein